MRSTDANVAYDVGELRNIEIRHSRVGLKSQVTAHGRKGRKVDESQGGIRIDHQICSDGRQRGKLEACQIGIILEEEVSGCGLQPGVGHHGCGQVVQAAVARDTGAGKKISEHGPAGGDRARTANSR